MSKPLSLAAQILVDLEARAGEWVALSALKARIAAPPDHIELLCKEFVRAGHIAYARLQDEPYYGQRVEGVTLSPASIHHVAHAALHAEAREAIRAVLQPLHAGLYVIAMHDDAALCRALRQTFERTPALEALKRKHAALLGAFPEPITTTR